MYLHQSAELDRIPVESLKNGLGAKMCKSENRDIAQIALDTYNDSVRLLKEAQESRNRAKLGTQSRIRLSKEKLKPSVLQGTAGNDEEAVVLADISAEALSPVQQALEIDYNGIGWEVLVATATNDQGMNDNNLIALFHSSRRQLLLARTTCYDQHQ